MAKNILLTVQNLYFLTLTSVLLLSPETSVSCCTASNSCWTPVADFLYTPPASSRAHMCASLTRLLCLLLRINASRGPAEMPAMSSAGPLSGAEGEEGKALFSSTQLSRQQSAGGAGETLARPLERRRNSFHLTPSLRPRSFAS